MTKNKIHTIDVQQLQAQINQDSNLCLIDVREPEEWQQGHIAEAMHIPLAEIAKRISSDVPDQQTAVYLQCKAGVRSMHAAQIISELGYSEVYSVDGGIMDWINAGYPVVR